LCWKITNPLAPGFSLIELASEPSDLLGRETYRPRLLRVEPNEPKSVQARRAVWLANVTAKPRGTRVILDIMVADQRKMRHFEATADLVEELELFVGPRPDVVADELDESRPDQIVDVVDDPADGP